MVSLPASITISNYEAIIGRPGRRGGEAEGGADEGGEIWSRIWEERKCEG